MRSRQLATIVLVLVAAGAAPAQELSDATYEKWRDHVLPRPGDLAYRQVPWRPSFWEAVVEAHAAEKPVLLWAMNGHPLCNT